jgi:O-acetyl-ADP-ribose deacetylase (regulator of RNase III)
VAFKLDLFYAWKKHFADCANVETIDGDILAQTADALVSPANSFGYMDGGIDLLYSQFFGWQLETRLKQMLLTHYYGELPVGQAVIVSTEHKKIPFLISAPTMRIPSNIQNTVNVYLAFRAALIAVLEHNKTSKQQIKSVLCPGLGTGVGGLEPEIAAKQMRFAYDAIFASKKSSARAILNEHYCLLN